MKKIEEKINKIRKEYDEILEEGETRYQKLLEENSKENHKEYDKLKRKELRKIRQLMKMYFQYFKNPEIKYEEWIRDEISGIRTGDEKSKIWIVIMLLGRMKNKEDLSGEICKLSDLILSKKNYNKLDDYYLESLIDLLYLKRNPIQVPILKKVILKEQYEEFKLIGKAISYLKSIKSKEVEEILKELRNTERYKTDEIFRNNINDDLDPEFWNLI